MHVENQSQCMQKITRTGLYQILYFVLLVKLFILQYTTLVDSCMHMQAYCVNHVNLRTNHQILTLKENLRIYGKASDYAFTLGQYDDSGRQS